MLCVLVHPELKGLIGRVRDQTGYPVTVSGDPKLPTHSHMASASADRPVHAIFVNPTYARFGDYLVALQCGMLLSKWAQPDRIVDFTIRTDKFDYLVEKAARRAKTRQGAAATQYAAMIVRGVLQQLNSLPLQMMSIELVDLACPHLAAEQAALSGRRELQEMSKVLSEQVRDAAPPDIHQRSASMNAAFAAFWSERTGDSVCTLPYRLMGFAQNGGKLLAAYHAADPTAPNRHRQVVDGWAAELEMGTWYAWKERTP